MGSGVLLDRADLLELERHLAEREFRLQREHDPEAVVREPHARIGLLREDAAPIRDPWADDDGVPLLARHADTLPLQHVDDHGIALGPEVAAVLVALPDFERYGADPVEEAGTVAAVVSRPASR